MNNKFITNKCIYDDLYEMINANDCLSMAKQ